MSDMVRIEGVDTQTASVEGPPDVFTCDSFTLNKSRWIPDQECSSCSFCSSPFTSLRRKHHCRQCGRIYCAKCCFDKMPLPQLNTMNQERVCEQCKIPAKFVASCISKKLPDKLIGTKGLVEMLYTPSGLRKAIELGGIQALIFASKNHDVPLRETFCTALNTLTTHTSLHPYLIDAGAAKAVSRILLETDVNHEQLLSSCLSIFSVVCKSPSLIPRVLEDGALEPIITLVSTFSPALSLMALRVLSQLVEDPNTHTMIVNHRNAALNKIFLCTTSPDEQTKEAALRVLSLMALGSDATRQHIAQEDIFSGHCCQRVLSSRPQNTQVLVNAACLVANLAASEQTQGALKDLLLPLCRLLEDLSSHKELMAHTARGIANFARYKGHAHLLIPYVTNMFTVFVKAVDPAIRYQGLRGMISLMTHFPQQALVVLQQHEIIEIMKVMAERAEVMDSIHNAILQVVPSETKPC